MTNQANISEIIFVTGEQKNAGKTTFLKHLLFEARKKNKNFIVLSVGVDGEKSDAVYGNSKPEITLEKGDMVITTEDAINNSIALFEIIDIFENNKFNKRERPILARAVRGGNVEIISAGSNVILSDILFLLKQKVNPDIIFIDGAADRITQVASYQKAQFYYVVKIDNTNFLSAIDNILKLDILSKLPVFNGEQNVIKIDGALTKNKLDNLKNDDKSVVVGDFTKIFLKLSELKILLKKQLVYVQNYYDLKKIVVITNGVADDLILDTLVDSEVVSKIIFNPYES